MRALRPAYLANLLLLLCGRQAGIIGGPPGEEESAPGEEVCLPATAASFDQLGSPRRRITSIRLATDRQTDSVAADGWRLLLTIACLPD